MKVWNFAVSLKAMNSNDRELFEALASELEAENQPKRERKPLTRGRLGIILIASLLSVAFAIFTVISTIAGSRQVKTADLGFEVISAQQVSLTFAVTTPSAISEPTTCAVKALNQQFAIVGYREVKLPINTVAQEPIEVAINTTELAVSSLVDYCWLD